MKKVEVKVVIGSNYGDECKGLATHYFSVKAAKSNKKCLNVLFNGGCQRGHTVEIKNPQLRHVFHHFGCGTFDGASTYFDQNFIVNPIFFCEEQNELNNLGFYPICFISPNCRVSTPYDAFINQIVEASRGENKHGSCGYGIWETQKRYENSEYALTFGQMANMQRPALFKYLKNIAHVYLPKRLKEYGINEIPLAYKKLLGNLKLIDRFIDDFETMKNNVLIIPFQVIVKLYDYIIFEGAQGLALDEKNTVEYPNVTASSTTSKIPIERVNFLDCDIEICYITRSYFTRHGAGKLPNECKKSEINPLIEDYTNIYNEYQDSIRYAPFNTIDFIERVMSDLRLSIHISKNHIKSSVLVSHLNYTYGDIFGDCTLKELKNKFDYMYCSSSKYIE